ncbi:hypothetical protein HYR54_13535 [Candidatus Acetothermia bacterium]|nr:hypothetical protein [Candidatus Acetothermia bacterium]MBI3460817.1 hypothetical protein [Candidatus Acetothermia bacterium]MBI3659646.1 hypothetical protein [Candidatus Acetothermia bacterium]
MSTPLRITKGSLFLYYCFDIADEIALDKIEKIFGEAPTESRLVCERLTPEYVQYRKVPLLVYLEQSDLKTRSLNLRAECRAKIYDFGVVTIIFKIPIMEETLTTLSQLSAAVVANEEIRNAAEHQMERLRREIEPAIAHPQTNAEAWEDYAIFVVQNFDSPLSVHEILESHAGEIAKTLLAEVDRLSEAELSDAVKNPLSYYENELAFIDWHAAFLYDPRMSYDVPDVLEYAVTMLLELRTYDAILDDTLETAYQDLEGRASPWSLSPYASTIGYLSQVKLDVSEVIEKATNSLKLVGDLYLAKVYSAAAARFSLDSWEKSVREKLQTIESIYDVLYERTTTRRLLVLEVFIVILFVIDIFLIFFERK